MFCKRCGTRLFAWRRNGTLAGVALATFDDRNAFAPTEHIWVSEKLAWLKLDDGLVQHQANDTGLTCTIGTAGGCVRGRLQRGISEPASPMLSVKRCCTAGLAGIGCKAARQTGTDEP